MTTQINVEDFLNLTQLASGYGPLGTTAQTMLKGLNILKGLPAIPHNIDHQGYIFFTKPACNLTYNNLATIPDLNFLLDSREGSMPNAIRCMLSPNLFGTPDVSIFDNEGLRRSNALKRSEMIDDKCAFLPITNFLETMSALPDTQLDVYNSAAGKRGEQISFYDGFAEQLGAYDLTATFDNMDGDFVTATFKAWIEYGNRILEGTAAPFPVLLLNDEIDYASRMYRIILDRSRRFLQNIYCTGYMFPTTNPDGAKSGFDRKDTFRADNNKVSITFHCIGAEKDRPISLLEFNKVVTMFNPDMIDKSNMVKLDQSKSTVPFNLQALFNWESYPYINLETYEFEWWTPKNTFDARINAVTEILKSVNYPLQTNEKTSNNSKAPMSVSTLQQMVLDSPVGAEHFPELVKQNNSTSATASNTSGTGPTIIA